MTVKAKPRPKTIKVHDLWKMVEYMESIGYNMDTFVDDYRFYIGEDIFFKMDEEWRKQFKKTFLDMGIGQDFIHMLELVYETFKNGDEKCYIVCRFDGLS